MTTDPAITIAGLRAERDYFEDVARSGAASAVTHAAHMVMLTAERDALAAALATVTAERDEARAKAPCAIHSYEHGPGPCMTCGAWPPGTASLIAGLRADLTSARSDLASERHHVATYRDRMAALEAEHAKVAALKDRVEELEERPVLTVERLADALDASYGIDGTGDRNRAEWVVAHLGAVTLPAFAGVSVEELIKLSGQAYLDCPCRTDEPVDCCNVASIRAVLARLKVSLVAPVDPEAFARKFADIASDTTSVSRPPRWDDYSDESRAVRIAAMRAALIAAGIPVTPEAAK